jgi:hypothetical protein
LPLIVQAIPRLFFQFAVRAIANADLSTAHFVTTLGCVEPSKCDATVLASLRLSEVARNDRSRCFARCAGR